MLVFGGGAIFKTRHKKDLVSPLRSLGRVSIKYIQTTGWGREEDKEFFFEKQSYLAREKDKVRKGEIVIPANNALMYISAK